jgi:hemolysin activation/secretion protein
METPFVLPPVPESESTEQPVGPRFLLHEVRFTGNNVYSDEQLQALAAPFIEQSVNMADLEEIRHRITQYYVDHGYVNSGALLQDQHIVSGVVDYQIVEGTLSDIRITGSEGLRPAYISNRLRLGVDKPLNAKALQERFQLLLRDPLIERLNGELRPGIHPGESILDLAVVRAKPYGLIAGVDNHRPPSTGAETASVSGWVRNLTGYGDVANLFVAGSDGAVDAGAGYEIPVSARDTRIKLRYEQIESSIVEEPLADLDVDSKTHSIEAGITHPVTQSLRRDFKLGATIALRRNKTSLLGQPFSFSPGAENGKTRVSVLRLIQEYSNRTPVQAVAARSTFHIGLDAFNATVHDDLPDGQFFVWIGQVEYARRTAIKHIQWILRGDIQLSSDELLPLERIAIGGATTVRGYRENQLVRDEGYAFSAEMRYPVWGQPSNPEGTSTEFAVFADSGAAWNKGQRDDADYLSSLGIGLREHWWRIFAELYVAHALNEVHEPPTYNLQDDGIHFQATVRIL